MNVKEILAVILAVAVLAVAGAMFFGGKTETVVMPQKNSAAPAPVASESKPAAEITPVENKIQIQPAPVKTDSIAEPQKTAAQTATPAGGKAPLQDPVARDALSFVGVDPDAEAYWLDAISDSTLPDKEREDLMEDLNEDGLSDPKHPGPQDIPLILNRIALIEEIAPSADPFMQEHLGEAYKDLNNMLAGQQ